MEMALGFVGVVVAAALLKSGIRWFFRRER
jgi:hypothetical protein